MQPKKKQFDPDADDFWDIFGEAGLEQKIETFLAVLDSGKMDEELAFEMLEEIVNILPEGADQHARYAELVWRLREKAPEVYKKEGKYFLRSLISFAIEDDRWDEIPSLLDFFRNETDVDIYYNIVYQMAYHGLEKLIVPVMADALPKIKTAPDLVEWAADEFASEIGRLMLWDYLNTNPTPAPQDSAFLAATAPYIPQWKEGWLERFIPRLTARAPSEWKSADFSSSLGNEQLQTNIHNLLAEFVADQHWRGIPYGRADMAWEQIAIAIVKQAGIGQTKKGRSGKSKEQRSTKSVQTISLIPAYGTLDRSLVDLAQFLGAKPFHLAATIELLPAYLRFLTRLGLATEEETARALHNLRPLTNNISRTLKYYGADGRCIANVLAAWEEEKAR
ncbi:MAG: hypothetical protein AB1509_02965 [Chloroflexota bacterium]